MNELVTVAADLFHEDCAGGLLVEPKLCDGVPETHFQTLTKGGHRRGSSAGGVQFFCIKAELEAYGSRV